MQQDPELRRLVDRVREAGSRRAELDIRGGGSKQFYGESPRGEPLDVTGLRGVSSYEPSELVVTSRAGTSLAELEATTAQCGQCLPFEPPRFAPGGTVGGMVAAGLSGPARSSVGSLRDFLLGVTMLDGRGEILQFGGQVMKNVAGYDVSRLLAGSWGVLGVILEVSLKVVPVARMTATLSFDCGEPDALRLLQSWAAQPLPLRASCWCAGRLMVRLEGAASAVLAAQRSLGGAELAPEEARSWWESVRDHGHDFFRLGAADLAQGACLWRLSVPAVTAPLDLPGPQLIEWGGALRWWRGSAPADRLRAAAARAGGHATLVRAADKSPGAFARPSEALMQIHRRLKQAFDPQRLFNPGRLYADL
jgi:glycolate dehydrogenase FAD-binding subunit